MSELLEYMYPQAVETGIPATEYWSMTLEEIMIQISANKKSKENELREKAMFDYSQQRLAVFAFNDPKKFPTFEEAYPFLKKIKEEVEKTGNQEEQKAVEMLKQQQMFMAQAEAIKATRERRKNSK